jgi:hypothetical protein
MKKLSIIIANRNDLAMLSVTVRSCIEELSIISDSNIIICDNSDSQYWPLIKSVIPTGYIKEKKIILIRQDFPCLFTAREAAIRESDAEYVICLDSHMIAGHDTFLNLVNFMDRNKNKPIGFAHAPIIWINKHESNSRHDRDISISELGPWGSQYLEERKITWKGMPWICKRDWFLNELRGYGALSENKLSWGGGDMHIGTKSWLLGYENWAVPCRPCTHIGPFSKGRNEEIEKLTGYKYRVYSDSGKEQHTFGFLVSCYILGGEAMMDRNAPFLKERFGIDTDLYRSKAIEYGKDEREWLLKEQKMSYERYLEMWKGKSDK